MELTTEEKKTITRMVSAVNLTSKPKAVNAEELQEAIVDENIDNESMISRLVRLSGLGHLVGKKREVKQSDPIMDSFVGEFEPVAVLRKAIKESEVT